jgi:5-methylcytosine-specific restriction enzyme subunit McrC
LRASCKHITVFEHQTLKLNQKIGDLVFDRNMLEALQKHYGTKGVPYYTLTHNGVRFNEHVGVIQVGTTVIEVLPKADKSLADGNEKENWRKVLINMLLAVGMFDVHAPSSSQLKLKPNSILDLYFGLFIKETEYLLHSGLVKKYRKSEGNVKALKGNLQFAKHIQHNHTHHERFYVRHTVYDVQHKLHFILYKTILLLKQINTSLLLQSRIGALLLNFPEVPDIKVTPATFDKMVYNRKTLPYKKAIDIARLLLLNYHPDVTRGGNNILALMFDMNTLWEQFVYISLRKHKSIDTTVTPQTTKHFWKPEKGRISKIRPDIVLKGSKNCMVLDTKWKNLNGHNPSPEDLRQMFVYHQYYSATRVALVYPGDEKNDVTGNYIDINDQQNRECRIINIFPQAEINKWKSNIYNRLIEIFGLQN